MDDLKQFIADEIKHFTRHGLPAKFANSPNYEVRQIDTADSLKAHVTMQTPHGVRMFTISVKEVR